MHGGTRTGGVRFDFAIAPLFRGMLIAFGVLDADDAHVLLDDERLTVRFGHWSMSTPVRNLAGARVVGPFRAAKVIGPHLSFADGGATFGTSTERGVCIRFHRPIPGLDPLDLLRHPGVTVTVGDPEGLAAAVERHAAAAREHAATRSAPIPQPGPLRRAGAILRYPLGLTVSTARYLRRAAMVERTEEEGDVTDLPPLLPEGMLDAHLKTVDEGSGPLLHRTFRVGVRGAALDATGLMDRLRADLDRAAPSEVASFRKLRGRLGELGPGDEYVVTMAAPWSGPVRVVHRDATSFRFATLARHLEAGQIEFAAHDVDDGLEFVIETWARPGDRAAEIVIDRLGIGKEIQLHMWTQFCVATCGLAGREPDGPIRVRTRRVPWPPPAPRRDR